MSATDGQPGMADNAAWQRDSSLIMLASRVHAEEQLLGIFAEHGLTLGEEHLNFARAAIMTGAVSGARMLREAGWLRDEPALALKDTAVLTWAAGGGPLLDWDITYGTRSSDEPMDWADGEEK